MSTGCGLGDMLGDMAEASARPGRASRRAAGRWGLVGGPVARSLVARALAVLCVLAVGVAAGAVGTAGPARANDARVGDPRATDALATVLGVRFGDHSSKMRVVLDISRQADFEISYTVEPMAVVVDFAPLELDVPRTGDGVGFIERYQIRPRLGGSRVRLLLSRPARAGEVFYIPATPDAVPRFVLDLVPVSNADLANLAGLADAPEEPVVLTAPAEPVASAEPGQPERDHEALAAEALEALIIEEGAGGVIVAPEEGADGLPAPATATASAPADDPVADIIQTASLIVPPLEDLAPVAPAPEAAGALDGAPDDPAADALSEAELELASFPIPQPKPPPPPLPLIVIDPGHGGYDPGAVSASGILEKEITMKAALVLRRLLLRSGDYEVALTREEDVFMALRDRVEFARSSGAAMFLSLHADSIDDPRVRGASVYTLSEVASDREAAALAMRENRAGALTDVNLAEQDDDVTVSILIDLAQRQSRSFSKRLADLLIAGIADVQPTVRNTHRQAGFAVLTAPDVPSVLVELGYLSSDADVRMLRDERHITRLMSSIAQSVDRYFSN